MLFALQSTNQPAKELTLEFSIVSLYWKGILAGSLSQLRAEGRNPKDGTRLRFWGPSRNSTPRFSNSGSWKPPPRGRSEAWQGSQRAWRGSSGASERRVHFQRSEKRRWATQRPLRGPIFSQMPPEGVPTLGLPPSGQRKLRTLQQ